MLQHISSVNKTIMIIHFYNNKNDDSLFLDEPVTVEEDKHDFHEDTITMRSFKKMKR